MTTIKTALIFAALGALASCQAVAPAFAAAPVCKPRAELVDILAKEFAEHQWAFGLQNDRRVLELYVSADGTWTAILSMASGESCVVAAGEAFTVTPPPPTGDPA
ncbi:hypothetical protein ATO13_23361 [Stappia sp. 22II-S9-Z10]|nr:hypothetical protein ATO13_23361 [Stappia sp. 22II-S9-Z10]